MSDETVQHRFVQIHQACEKASSTPDELRNLLSRASTIAASHSCEKIYSRVAIKHDLDYLNTIQNLQNLILTSDDEAKNKVYLRTLTRLLIYNQRNNKDKIQFHHNKLDSRLVHPFAVIMRQKPTMYFSMLDEIDSIFAQDAENTIATIEGFVNAVFLTENNVDSSALLVRLANTHSNLVDNIDQLISSLIINYPMQRDSVRYLSLVDLLLSSKFLGKCSVDTPNHYVYAFLDRLLTICSQGQSITLYLVRFQRMIDAFLQSIHVDLIWVSLSFLLLKAQTLDEQDSIMICKRMILASNRLDNVDVLRVAYLPLYQLLSELNDKDASTELKNLKENVLSLISYLDQDQHEADHEEAKNRLQLICKNHRVYGLLGHLSVYLDMLYEGSSPVDDENYDLGSDGTLALNMLFTTPFVFKRTNIEAFSVYYRLTIISTLQETSYKFPMLLFLLRLVHVFYQDAHFVAHIFRDIIPILADVNDPTITSKVLQMILSSIYSSGSVDSTMASLGVKALAHIHRRQPRVWQELKKVFSEWVLRRKSVTLRRKIDLSITGPIKMELAVLTTMRDICKERPRECAPDVLPMVISLLQTCQDLSMASLSLITSTVNYCVKAGLAEPRSIWNVALVYLAQFAFEQGTRKSALLVEQLCKFYSIAGAKQDASEPYLQFKESLLAEYILPLIDSDDKNAASYAMFALADFSAQDMASILPEKAVDYISKACYSPIEHQDLVLASLISNELDHMRRGLFKEECNIATKQSAAVEKNQTIVNDAGQPVGERETDIQSMFVNLWEDARVAPGLRSGYAIALLHTLNQPSRKEARDSLEAISKTKWYRFMVTSFTDVSLTDHLLLRVSSIGSWEAFFKHALSDTESDMEAVVVILLKDLLARLERSTVPGVTCNIFMAMTGLVHVARVFIPSFVATCVNDIIQILMNNYIELSGSPLSHSAHLMSEEVQFAARFVLGHLTPFVISNEKTAETVSNVLMDAAVNTNSKFRNIDTAVDLVQFANGYAAGHFSASLSAYPSPTEHIENMKTNNLQMLLSYCSTQGASDSRIVGILMGLASKSRSETMGDELSFATESLQAYLGGENVNKGRLLGSTWLCSVGARQADHVNYELSVLVESTVAAASNDPNLSQHFYHFTVPYSQIQQHSHLYSDVTDGEAIEQFYKQSFEPLLTSIDTDDASSNYRIASLFGVGSLLGANYLNINQESIYLQAQRYHASSRRVALDKLAAVAGLTVRSAPTGNLKSGRVAAAVCGKVIEQAQWMQRSLDDTAIDNIAVVASSSISSSEPTSYNRLNSNTSYLRAVFDHLATANTDAATLLLNSLILTPGPLPPVNWFTVLIKLFKVLPKLCFAFASKHAATSFSLSEFLITQMMAMLKAGEGYEFLFDFGGAFDAVLELAGLVEKKTENTRRGMNAVVKKMTLSESRIMELLEICLKSNNKDILGQTLIHLSRFLPSPFVEQSLDDNKTKLASSIRQFVYQSIMLDLLETEESSNLISLAAKCSITDLDQLFPSARLNDWDQFSTQSTINRITAVFSLHGLAPASKKQSIVKYLSTSVTYLIGCNASVPGKEIWQDISEVIGKDVSQDNKKAMAWIIRVLDAFVVYMGAFDSSSIFDDQVVVQGLCSGLREVLALIQHATLDPVSISEDMQLADAVYRLDYYVNLPGDFNTEQEQVVKRLFTLLDMTRKLQAETTAEFFYRLTLGLPQEYVLQYEVKY